MVAGKATSAQAVSHQFIRLRPARMLGVRVREGGRTLRAAQHRCVTHERVVGSWGRAVGQGRVGSGARGRWATRPSTVINKSRVAARAARRGHWSPPRLSHVTQRRGYGISFGPMAYAYAQ